MVMGLPLSNELDGWDEGSLKGLSFGLFSGCLDTLGRLKSMGRVRILKPLHPNSSLKHKKCRHSRVGGNLV